MKTLLKIKKLTTIKMKRMEINKFQTKIIQILIYTCNIRNFQKRKYDLYKSFLKKEIKSDVSLKIMSINSTLYNFIYLFACKIPFHF